MPEENQTSEARENIPQPAKKAWQMPDDFKRIFAAIDHFKQQQEYEPTEEDFREWVASFPGEITPLSSQATIMAGGFEYYRNSFPLQKFKEIKCDAGLNDFLQRHLSPEDYKKWQVGVR